MHELWKTHSELNLNEKIDDQSDDKTLRQSEQWILENGVENYQVLRRGLNKELSSSSRSTLF